MVFLKRKGSSINVPVVPLCAYTTQGIRHEAGIRCNRV
jgi:hypothetical protein